MNFHSFPDQTVKQILYFLNQNKEAQGLVQHIESIVTGSIYATAKEETPAVDESVEVVEQEGPNKVVRKTKTIGKVSTSKKN